MNFASLRFWGLLLAGLSAIAILRWACLALRPAVGGRFDRLALLALGMFLLLNVSWVTFVIWVVISVGTYFGLWLILRFHRGLESRYLWVLIPLQLAPLFYFKYANFALNGVLGLGFNSICALIIPVGVSFYTFQNVAFAVDTLQNREPLPAFLDYMDFAGFFPQIVAGPIERKHNLLLQMEQFRFRWSAGEIDQGVTWMALGMFFKLCLADNIAFFFHGTSTSNAYSIWLDNLLFGLRIYYDFAGYSLVAFGVARCLGVKLTLNFASPYCSTSIQEFWNRWHISLSQWLRDYVFVPVRGLPIALGLGLVFLVCGVWHGAGWNFVLWGSIHEIAMIIRHFCRKLSIPSPLGWLGTMGVVFLAFLFFYETRTGALMAKFKALLTPGAYNFTALREAVAGYRSPHGFVLLCFLLLAGASLLLEWLSLARRNEPYYFLRRPVVLAGLVILTVLLAPTVSNGFIYFAF